MSELLRATIALQEDSIQMQEKENERLHTLHLQRTKLTTKVIKERDEVQDEVERLTTEVTGLRGLVRAVDSETNIPMEEIEQSIDNLKEYKGNAA